VSGPALWRNSAIAGVVVLGAVLAIVLWGAGSHASSGAPAEAQGPRAIGRLDPGRRIRVALALRLDWPRVNRRLQAVELGRGRGSRPLDATEFGRRFGLDRGELATLRARLAGMGLHVVHTYRQRTATLVRGSVGQLSRLFAISFVRYRDATGARYYATRGRPRIPATLRRYVSGVGDLSNVPPTPLDIPARGLTPQTIANAYDITPLWSNGFEGAGQTIAVTSLGTFDPADIRAYDAMVGATGAPPIQRVAVDGGSNDRSNPEVALDLEVIRGIARKATIIDYESPGVDSVAPTFADLYNKIVQDGKASIVSTSYGVCEPSSGAAPDEVRLLSNALAAAVAHGITVFASSGDNGAFDCLHNDLNDTQLAVPMPTDNPNVVSVGGTALSVRKGGSYLGEQAWSDPVERSGGGGGVSAIERRPAWQAGPGVAKAGTNPSGRRQTPDVAGPAAPSSGFRICFQGDCTPGVGGTSAAAPFWAASTALVQEYADANGAGGPRFVAPILYALAAHAQPFPPFHDITHGNNGYYPATPGWDYATGLGSPDVANLAHDYADYVRSLP
jgi:kumamolisin